jgi:adenine-specific DNA-methyltransferase
MAGPRRRGANKNTRVETFTHDQAKRWNIPTAELQSLVREDEAAPTKTEYPRKYNPDEHPEMYARNPDLDPQLVWRGKAEQDRHPLTVDTVPIYVQEKIHPKAIIDDLKRVSKEGVEPPMRDLFADFNGLPDTEAKYEFYAHAANWSNRMILGDSLLVMNSLAEKEGLRGQVQMIYIDPPYGIKFASNWQFSTRTTKVQDGKSSHITKEPEVIKAFRDTWDDGVSSYLSYLRQRLMPARDLLTDSGSLFVQMGDENVHLVRCLLDEIFGTENFQAQIQFQSASALSQTGIARVYDYILWYTKDRKCFKFRSMYTRRDIKDNKEWRFHEDHTEDGHYIRLDQSSFDALENWNGIFRRRALTSSGYTESCTYDLLFRGHPYRSESGKSWATTEQGMRRLDSADRMFLLNNRPQFKTFYNDFSYMQIDTTWSDKPAAQAKLYAVETAPKFIERCMLMCTDPGDLVIDPTCGSGTTALVAERWGRRWITIDTSRVALAVARQRLTAATFEYYFLKDSLEGAQKEGQLTGRLPVEGPLRKDIRQGFVYERVAHITLRSIANNAEIDVIYEKWQRELEPLREALNRVLGKGWEEWEIPRQAGGGWSAQAKDLHVKWWEGRQTRQAEIDASIAKNAETEYLYDQPYAQKGIVRVTGPFTVESLSPHRVLPADEEDEAWAEMLREEAAEEGRELPPRRKGVAPNGNSSAGIGDDDFVRVVLDNLERAGVENTKKGEQLEFTSLKPWPGRFVHAEGRYEEQGKERRAAIFIGPEYGTVTKADVLKAAREAADLFDVLIVCGFAFEAHVGDETLNLGRLRVLKARMNQDLRMPELKRTGAGNLFVVFGEPEIEVREADGDQLQVEIKGVEVYDPNTDQVRTSGVEDIACWFIDTDYDQESFFVRHAYFLGGRDPYEKLKRALKAEIDEDAWATLYSATSRPFPKPKSGQIAVKVINHYGDEVLKVYPVAAS